LSLAPGARLGPYEILSLVGAGGMGEVYKARDMRLDRTVAVKILAPALAEDAQFRERFDREARTISRLDHPHICALHDVGEQNGTAYLVMQYLEGETLAERLRRGPLQLPQALATAIEIASALDKAHQAGIIHRDLKPGNILLTKAGAKLLDFGLAKSIASVVTNDVASTVSPTTPSLTVQGAVLGTLQYMAPEQIEGGESDARTDIFAFGLVLYEMVTGSKAFSGKTHASLLSSILKDEPRPLSEVQPLASPLLDHIVSRCLAKDPDERWQGAGDLTRELQWISRTGLLARRTDSSTVSRQPNGRLALGICAAAAGLVVGSVATVIVAGLTGGRSGPRPAAVVRSIVGITPAEHLQALATDHTTNEGRPSRTSMAWSPDGRSIAFSALEGGRQQLYLRRIDQISATAMAGTDGGGAPFFSPDGRWVGFWSGDALMKTPADGNGPATMICETPTIFGAAWNTDDTIIFSRAQLGLWRVSAAGGKPEVVAAPDIAKGELKYLLPHVLPDGRTVIFTLTHTPLPTWEDTEVAALSLATKERRVLVQSAADGRYLTSGHLVYIRRGTLMAMPFNLARLEPSGGAVALIAGVMQGANEPSEAFDTGAGQFSVSSSGALLYLPGGVFPDPERSLVWVDRATGTAEALPLPTKAYLSPRISPDGRQVVVWTQGDRNVWVHDLARGTLQRLTSEARSARAIWTLDGKSITYGSALNGNENIYVRPADGSGPAERLTTSPNLDYAAAWSPTDHALAYVETHAATGNDIMIMSLADRRPRQLVATRFADAYPDFSPDGRWLAYASTDEKGESDVYVQPYPGPGPRQQVSARGGTAPTWSHDGRELFYTTTQTTGGQAALTKMMVVPVTLRPTFTAGTPRELFEGRYGATAGIRAYDVSADGRRFLMVQQKERPAVAAAEMILVQNWLDELKARVPAK
jgi:eukaryotic-like serine/threonine-protein kinase